MKIKYFKLLMILLSLIIISCEKTDIINSPHSNYKSITDLQYLDSLQGSYYGYFCDSNITGGAGQLEWNFQTNQLDTIRQYYKISNDTLTWIHWNDSQDALWSAYFVPCEGIDCYYIITDIDVYYQGNDGWDANVSYKVDSSGIILKTGVYVFRMYRNKNTFPDTSVLKTQISNMQPFALRYNTPFDIYDSLQPDIIFGPTQTLDPSENNSEFVELNWVVGDDIIDGWLLYIKKDNEMVMNGLVIPKNQYVDAHKKYYKYYYTEPGNYTYYVKSFTSFGVSENSNITPFTTN